MGSDDDVRGIGFAAPSVTPLMFEGGVNPSVRIYDYDPENRMVIDYETVNKFLNFYTLINLIVIIKIIYIINCLIF
jgi:hypothetical protein